MKHPISVSIKPAAAQVSNFVTCQKMTSALLLMMFLEEVLGDAVKRGRNWGGLTASSVVEAEPVILPLIREGLLPLVP
jgi:hypothetical protein